MLRYSIKILDNTWHWSCLQSLEVQNCLKKKKVKDMYVWEMLYFRMDSYIIINIYFTSES